VTDFSKVHGPAAQQTTINHLQVENQKLQGQLQMQQMVIQQRGLMAVSVFAEGLMIMVLQARAGDATARQTLKMLREAFDEMRLVGGLVVPGQQ
jgi:hypothetical protein